jgi:Pyridoxamine 5'-phosphate oxidase
MERDFDHQLVYSFFRQHPLCTLSTVSEEGIPQTAAVYVYVDAQMQCYIATRESTRKANNIKKNNIAVISGYDENVLMFGELSCSAELLTAEEDVAMVLPELQKIVASRKDAYWVPPVAQLKGEGFILYRLTPKKVTFMNYDKSDSENPQPYVVSFEM